MMMLNHLAETVALARTAASSHSGGAGAGRRRAAICTAPHLTEFRLEMGLPVWRYEIDGYVIEKRVLLPHRQNTVHVDYRLLHGDGPVRLKLRPVVALSAARSAGARSAA